MLDTKYPEVLLEKSLVRLYREALAKHASGEKEPTAFENLIAEDDDEDYENDFEGAVQSKPLDIVHEEGEGEESSIAKVPK